MGSFKRSRLHRRKYPEQNHLDPLVSFNSETIRKILELVLIYQASQLNAKTTDGEENTFKEFTVLIIRWMIDELKAMGCVFIFIGANIDVEKVAAQNSGRKK